MTADTGWTCYTSVTCLLVVTVAGAGLQGPADALPLPHEASHLRQNPLPQLHQLIPLLRCQLQRFLYIDKCGDLVYACNVEHHMLSLPSYRTILSLVQSTLLPPSCAELLQKPALLEMPTWAVPTAAAASPISMACCQPP